MSCEDVVKLLRECRQDLQTLNEILESREMEREKWINRRVEELVSKGGDYYPYNVRMYAEAFADIGAQESIAIGSWLYVASISETDRTHPLAQAGVEMMKYLERYAREVARNQAEVDWDRRG